MTDFKTKRGFACRRESSPNQWTKYKLVITFNESDRITRGRFEGQFWCESDLAIGLQISGQTVWLPKSQITDERFDEGTITWSAMVPLRVIGEKGLDIYIEQ